MEIVIQGKITNNVKYESVCEKLNDGFSDLWIISRAILEHSYLFVLKMVQMDPKQRKCPMKIFLLFLKF